MNTTITQNLIENVETNLKPKAIRLTGKVSKYDGNLLECDGFPANIGAICEVETDLGTMEKAEIVGFNNGNSNIRYIHEYDADVNQEYTTTLQNTLEINKWYHLLVIRDDIAKSVDLYLNDVIVGNYTYTNSPNGSDDIQIGVGAAANGSLKFDGFILVAKS